MAGLGEHVGEAFLAGGQPAGRVAHEAVLQQNRTARTRQPVQLHTECTLCQKPVIFGISSEYNHSDNTRHRHFLII
jgi:hypothetical protein